MWGFEVPHFQDIHISFLKWWGQRPGQRWKAELINTKSGPVCFCEFASQIWNCFFLIGTNKFYNADKYILQVVQMQLQLLNLYFLLKSCTNRLDSAVSGNLHPSYESCLNLYKYILQCIQIHSASSTNAITTWKLVQSVWTALFLGICIRAIIDRRRRLLQQLDEIL